MSQPCEGHGLAHERVLWPCIILGMLTLETKYSCFCTQARTRACHDRVMDTGQAHGRMPDRVKIPVGVHLK